MRPKILFLDTEFSDLTEDAIIISIALVNEREEYYYAEFTDTYQISDCSDFVKESVLPLLFGGEYRKFEVKIKQELNEWISKQGPCIIATDAPFWDMKVTSPLLRGNWPANLNRDILCTPIVEETLNEAFLKEGWERHNALHDAVIMKRAFLFTHTILALEELLNDFSDK